MGSLIRFGVSMERDLLCRFDRLIRHKGYVNRSEAIRDLVRSELVQEDLGVGDKEAVGSVTLVYSHEGRELTRVLTKLQHQYHRIILSALHVHLDEHNCLEILAVKGRARVIKQIADRLTSIKGVKQGKLVLTETAEQL